VRTEPTVDDLAIAFARVLGDGLNTMDGLQAVGLLKDWLRDREVELVSRAREETHTWADIAEALHRDLSLMELLHGRGRHEP
jgi:hypothetical protein